MNNSHRIMYMTKEMREKLNEIADMLEITEHKLAEAQRYMVEAINHLEPTEIPIVRGKVDLKRIKFKLNKKYTQHII